MKRSIIALGVFFSLGLMAADFSAVEIESLSAPDALDCGEKCDTDYATCKTQCKESDYQCPIACYSTYTSCLAVCSR